MAINEKKQIAAICEGRIQGHEIRNEFWKEVISAKKLTGRLSKKDTEELIRYLCFLHKRSKFFSQQFALKNGKQYVIHALFQVFCFRKCWLRNYDTWRPRSHNPRKQFSHFLRHLFADYDDTPAFMDAVWFRMDRRAVVYKHWFVHMGLGGNIRHIPFELNLTKKEVHYFTRAPEDFTVEQALWRAIIVNLKGNEKMVKAFLAARPSKLMSEHVFWRSFIRYLVQHPSVDDQYIGPLVDFINYRKFNPIEYYEDGERKLIQPEQPNFSLSQRKPDNLFKLMNQWHGSLYRKRITKLMTFGESRYQGFSTQNGEGDHQYWKIYPLRTNQELFKEGRILKHCVASYEHDCIQKRCTIWSLSRVIGGKEEKRVTLEVDAFGTLVQARGKLNRDVMKEELQVIEQWTEREHIVISKFINLAY